MRTQIRNMKILYSYMLLYTVPTFTMIGLYSGCKKIEEDDLWHDLRKGLAGREASDAQRHWVKRRLGARNVE